MSKMPNYTSTTNACKLCKPLGASLAFRGIEGCVPFLHGSQGCATYMRRYIISHFNEPIDIASSSLGEKNAIYGGAANLKLGIKNVTAKYTPEVIGVATTCLTETIGDNVPMILHEYHEEFGTDDSPQVVTVSTPSYGGTHMEGFHAATTALVEQLTKPAAMHDKTNLCSGFISTADIRHLKEICEDMNIPITLMPDYSETLDGQALNEYPLMPKGGTPLNEVRQMGGAKASIELGATLPGRTPGKVLAERFSTKLYQLGLPMGIRETDAFFETLATISGKKIPEKYSSARGRLVDSMVDGHKYIFGKRAVVFGEEDLVVGLTSFLAEIGIKPVLCASGGNSKKMEKAIQKVMADMDCEMPIVKDNVDFYDIESQAAELDIDLVIGHSKGYAFAKKLEVPIIRVGFPVHDRVGGQRILHLGYHGAQSLFDTITNTIIAKKQSDSPVGYSYM